MRTVRTLRELSEALNGMEEYVYVEGQLGRRIVRMRVAGRFVWGVAGGVCLAGGVENVVALVAVGVAVAVSVYGAVVFGRNRYGVVRHEADGLVLKRK